MARRLHWVNDKAMFDWEIVRNGKVVALVPKEFDGDDEWVATNRVKAERRAKALDKRLENGTSPPCRR